MPTSATSGPLFTISSPSADLTSCLVNRLRAALDLNGSPECKLTWKPFTLPSGLQSFRLVPSARHTAASDSGLWPTPRAIDSTGNGESAESKRNRGSGGVNLITAAATWPPPTATDATRGAPETDQDKRARGAKTGHSLLDVAARPTPANRDYRHPNAKPYRERGGATKGEQLPNAAAAALGVWATPKTSDHRPGTVARATTSDRVNLNDQTHGAAPSGSRARTVGIGGLNPAFPSWLQGFPTEWLSCAPSAMPSSRRSRPSSSKP